MCLCVCERESCDGNHLRFFFFQLRWKPFEIPKASQKKVDFVNVSPYYPLLPTTLFSPMVGDTAIFRLDAKQKQPWSQAADSTTCLCLPGWPRDVLLTSTIWPLTPKGTRELFTSPNSQWKFSIYRLQVSLFMARTGVLSFFVPGTSLIVWKPVFLNA